MFRKIFGWWDAVSDGTLDETNFLDRIFISTLSEVVLNWFSNLIVYFNFNSMSDSLKHIKPLEDRILLKGVSDMQTTASGIIIPATASKDRPQKAEVLAVGPGAMKKDGSRIPLDVKVGDIVLVSKYAADEVKIEGEEYYIIRQSSILAVIA